MSLSPAIRQAVKALGEMVLSSPKNIGEAVWRLLAFSTVTGAMVSAVLLWRYPKLIQRHLFNETIEEQVIIDIFRRSPELKLEAMELIGQYIAQWGPSRFALINWNTQTGINEVWANESTKGWPTATDGIMSGNMREAVGHMIFSHCWSGVLRPSAPGIVKNVRQAKGDWAVCGMSDSFDLWGYLLVNWGDEHPPKGAVQALNTLSRNLERLLFGDH